MRVKLTLKELIEWIKENTNDKNVCLKDLYFEDTKVNKIKYNCYEYDMFIFQIEDGGLSCEDYDYSLGREITDTDFYAEKERWRAKEHEDYYYAILNYNGGVFEVTCGYETFQDFNNKIYLSGNYFKTREQAQKFADDLNKAVTPLFEKAKNGEYDEKD